MSRIVLGVTGGIAAYKSAILLRLLRKAGHDVVVIPTPSALEMVGRTTFEALSGHAVVPTIFGPDHAAPHFHGLPESTSGVYHVEVAKAADLFLIAPATANTIAKLAAGIADSTLTAAALVARCPIVIAPAMHTQMWEHPATVANIATLVSRGVTVIEPACGQLTGSDSGPGRLPEPEEIADIALSFLTTPQPDALSADEEGSADSSTGATVAFRHVVVTAGGTREMIDPVRYIGNRSTGVFGCRIAAAATAHAQHVTLIAANVDSSVRALVPPTVDVIEVESAEQMSQALDLLTSGEHAGHADCVIMAAAVADYRAVEPANKKLKKSSEATVSLQLEKNPDLLAGLVARRQPGQTIVGFAAETGSNEATALELAQEKAVRKGADFLVFNEVGADRGFGARPSAITVLNRRGAVLTGFSGDKAVLARQLMAFLATTTEPTLSTNHGE